MAALDFINQLKEFRFEVEDLGNNKIAFPYKIICGRFEGQVIKLGFQVPADFPLTPPSGPHISPPLLPMNPQAITHPQRTAISVFGINWQYWSRPFKRWSETHRTAKDYMKFINHLFKTQ